MNPFGNFKKYFIITNICVTFYAAGGKLTKKQQRWYVKRLSAQN